MATPVDGYLMRVRDHLAGIDHTEQLAFLDRQIKRWSDLYGAFSRMIDGSEDYTGSATAFDFLETLAGLDMMKKERENHA